jgi:hypothetical protein
MFSIYQIYGRILSVWQGLCRQLLMKRDPLTGMWFLRGQHIVVESVLTDKLDNGSSTNILRMDINTAQDCFGHMNEQSLQTTMSHFGIESSGKRMRVPDAFSTRHAQRVSPRLPSCTLLILGNKFIWIQVVLTLRHLSETTIGLSSVINTQEGVGTILWL